MPAKNKGRGKAPKNQHQHCQSLPEGEVLTDLKKKSWRIGKSCGSGGFGLIYTADEASKSTVKANANYVIKVEPHNNGPLFCEIAFYQRVAKPELIAEWRKQRKLSFVPVPQHIAHGLHEFNGESLRFLVMPRFGSDLHKLWLAAGKSFRRDTVAKIAIMMLNALEYMHCKEYVHADIKGANILCGQNSSNQLYLVDYGLAYRYCVDGDFKPYKPDPKKAHNGTIEYTSTDAHDGAHPSRRGDIEILGFFLLHLLAGKLPWEDHLSNCNAVRDSKKQHLKNPDAFVKSMCGVSVPVGFGDETAKQAFGLPVKLPSVYHTLWRFHTVVYNAEEISKLLEHSTQLEYEEKPDYSWLRDLFKKALKSMSVSPNSSLNFSTANQTWDDERSPQKRRPQKRKIVTSHPGRGKARKKGDITSSDNEDNAVSSSLESDAMPMSSSGPERKAARHTATSTSSHAETSSPFLTKSRKQRQQRKAPVLIESDSEDFTTEDFTPPVKAKQKSKTVKPRQPRRAKPQRQISNSENEEPRLVNGKLIPKATKPPPTVKTRTSPRKKTPLKSPPTLSMDSDSDEPLDGPSSSDLETISPAKGPRKLKQTSRYSMAPLHTEPVLTKTDQLTGNYHGKHPVFMRRRKKNVSKSDASTQTTPNLRRTVSKK